MLLNNNNRRRLFSSVIGQTQSLTPPDWSIDLLVGPRRIVVNTNDKAEEQS